MQDPFHAVKEEVEHSLAVVNQLHAKWLELRNATSKTDEFEWTSSELLSGLRSIDWDLQDLEDTVTIVETSRQKFPTSDAELQSRKDFIESCRQRVNSMRDEVQGVVQGGTSMKADSNNKGYGKVKATEDSEAGMEMGGQAMANADGDEILDMEGVAMEPPGGRHRRKKICVAVTLLLLLAGGVAAFATMPKPKGRVLAAASAELRPGELPPGIASASAARSLDSRPHVAADSRLGLAELLRPALVERGEVGRQAQ